MTDCKHEWLAVPGQPIYKCALCGMFMWVDKELIKQATTIEYGVDNGFDRVTFDQEKFAELVRADERNSWPAEMEAMERQVNILTEMSDRDAMKQALDAMRDAAFDEEGYIMNADLAEAHDALEARLKEKNT